MIKLYHNYKLGRLELELGLMEEKIVKSDEEEEEDEVMTIKLSKLWYNIIAGVKAFQFLWFIKF